MVSVHNRSRSDPAKTGTVQVLDGARSCEMVSVYILLGDHTRTCAAGGRKSAWRVLAFRIQCETRLAGPLVRNHGPIAHQRFAQLRSAHFF